MSEYEFLSLENVYDFSSDNINIFLILLDCSSSMCGDIENVQRGLKKYKKEFENFLQADSIAVAVSRFATDYYPGAFKKVKDMSTNYDTEGATALCYSIVKASEQLMCYIKEVSRRNGIIPRATFICMSDGEPYKDLVPLSKGRETVLSMNYAGITTVFVAFGKAISSEFGKEMGFQSTKGVENRNSLTEFMEELSQSCKEQSQSMKPLGSNFFSQANKDSSTSCYSQTTAQALDDDDWIDEI